MAKNDNLTDFLRGIADRLRVLLGTADLINPQDFEDKIQGVYDKGFSEGGPTGITATAPDVLTGKVFGSGGNTKSTGTMPKRASVSTASAVSYDGVRVTGRFPNGYYPNYDSSGAALYLPNANVASAIGLTAAKIVKGNTILGIAGTGAPLGAAFWYWNPQSGTANLNPNYRYGVVGSTLPAGTYRFVASWTPYADKYSMDLYVGSKKKSTAVGGKYSNSAGLVDTTFTISSAQSYYIKQVDTNIIVYGSAALVKIS